MAKQKNSAMAVLPNSASTGTPRHFQAGSQQQTTAHASSSSPPPTLQSVRKGPSAARAKPRASHRYASSEPATRQSRQAGSRTIRHVGGAPQQMQPTRQSGPASSSVTSAAAS